MYSCERSELYIEKCRKRHTPRLCHMANFSALKLLVLHAIVPKLITMSTSGPTQAGFHTSLDFKLSANQASLNPGADVSTELKPTKFRLKLDQWTSC